jgi:hypothetical protein
MTDFIKENYLVMREIVSDSMSVEFFDKFPQFVSFISVLNYL